jgi:hypothetical protein
VLLAGTSGETWPEIVDPWDVEPPQPIIASESVAAATIEALMRAFIYTSS